jgi:uncharacterized membrane protein
MKVVGANRQARRNEHFIRVIVDLDHVGRKWIAHIAQNDKAAIIIIITMALVIVVIAVVIVVIAVVVVVVVVVDVIITADWLSRLFIFH